MSIINDPLATQQAFRILLQALSRPGEIHSLSHLGEGQSWFLVLQTLLDHEVSFAVVGPNNDSFAWMVEDLTRCPFTDVTAADFIIITQGSSRGRILDAKRGTLEYPDQGATIIYLVEYLGREGDRGVWVKLQGPSINRKMQVRITGLATDEIHHLKEINQDFPLGVDCFFLDRAGQVMGLPRSILVEVQ